MTIQKRELKLVGLLLGTIIFSSLITEPIQKFIIDKSPLDPFVVGLIGFGIMLYLFNLKGD